MDLLKELQKVPAFEDVPEGDLAWIAERGEVLTLEEGGVFFERGDVIDKLAIVLEGEIEIRLPQKDGVMPLGMMKKGTFGGKLPFSRMQSAAGMGIVIKPAKIFTLEESYFSELIKTSEPIIRVLVWEMTDRTRDFTIRQRQHEKLLALGKLSAGLSHELNNPASAVLRSAEILKKHLGQTPERFKRVTEIRLAEEQIDAVNQAIFSCAVAGVKHLSLMERTQLEDDLLDWLEDHGVEEPDEIAENLADYKFSVDKLEFILEHVGEEFLDPVIRWTDNVLITERLVDEIEQASRRISDLVKSIKSYTHMDQAIQMDAVDIRPGIENTLTMLGHKLKQKQIEVDLDIHENLPKVHGVVGELNQVWTNLLDNAIDALPKGGLINIKAFCLPDLVRVQLVDNGPGIPKEVQSRIFEPFFTTKGIGEGTGLGLDIVKKVLHTHKGSIELNSEPGHTEFCVSLPISTKK